MLNTATNLSNAPIKIINMGNRQEPLRANYLQEPEAAWVVDSARTSSNKVDANNPLAGAVSICDTSPIAMPVGVHCAVGGDSDAPTPGDIFCAALAACLDSTIRIIANRLSVKLATLEIEVLGGVDVRGTLMIDKDVPVGFQRFDIGVLVRAADTESEKMLDVLITAAEKSCVVLQSIKGEIEIKLER